MEENKNETRNEEGNNKKLIKIILIVAVAFSLLSVAAIAAIGYLVYSMNMTKDEVQKKYIEEVYVKGEKKPDIERNLPPRNIPRNNNEVSPSNTDVAIGGFVRVTDEEIEKTYVAWYEELKNIASDDVYCSNYDECFIAGKITQGDERFIGENLYLGLLGGMGMSFEHFAIYEKGGQKYMFIFNEKKAPIAGIDDVPAKLEVDDLNTTFKAREWVNYFFKDVTEMEDHKIMKHDTLGKIYRAQDDCLVAELPDHTAKAYEFEVPFVDDKARKPKITFNDGTKNDGIYEYKAHSCVSLCTRYVHNDKVSSDDLKKVGKASNGDAIYALKNDHHSILEDLYNDKNTVAYFGDDWSDKLDHNKYSYEEYISMHPYLYWKDPFGNFVQFTNEKFMVAAEMCKPVVYFYSVDEKDLHFDVEPVGGFTHTEPMYDNGWNIRTIGDGRIRDNRSGIEYDSLLWEGMALGYDVPESGWVVASQDLNGFFDKKLSELGMNKKEIADFKEYWLERLDENLYYRISFMDRGQFDELAPLTFSEEPDNIIRVMMIAKGEDSYYELPEQNISNNTSRDGFTVVEWGGILER